MAMLMLEKMTANLTPLKGSELVSLPPAAAVRFVLLMPAKQR